MAAEVGRRVPGRFAGGTRLCLFRALPLVRGRSIPGRAAAAAELWPRLGRSSEGRSARRAPGRGSSGIRLV